MGGSFHGKLLVITRWLENPHGIMTSSAPLQVKRDPVFAKRIALTALVGPSGPALSRRHASRRRRCRPRRGRPRCWRSPLRSRRWGRRRFWGWWNGEVSIGKWGYPGRELWMIYFKSQSKNGWFGGSPILGNPPDSKVDGKSLGELLGWDRLY